LLNGYALDKTIVDAKSVREVAKDLKLKRKLRKIWGRIVVSLLITGMALTLIYLHQRGYLAPLYNEAIQVFHDFKRVVIDEFHSLLLWISKMN
jgi:hypothetical protein